MSKWIVYSKDGLTERCSVRKLEYSGSFMNERAVSATLEYHSIIDFEVFDYIIYRNEKFELESVPTVKKTSSYNYSYELRFVSLKYELERCQMRDIVPNDNGVIYPTPLSFSFTGGVKYLTERIEACLDYLYGEDVWNIEVADGISDEEKNITISNQSCWNALSLVNTEYGLSFYIKGRTITVGSPQSVVAHNFEYGKGNGLYEIERIADSDTAIITKLRAFGSTRNLDYSYPKRPYWADSVLESTFAFSPLRLMLPSFKLDGKTDYVLADSDTIAEYGIREASITYDDIYPSITGATNSSGQAIDEIKYVEEVDDSSSTFVVYLHDLGFSLEEHLTGEEPQISMKDGVMQGYTFNIKKIEVQEDGSNRLTLSRITTDSSDTSSYNIPNSDWNMTAGDKFVLLNMLMPQEYIRDAENRLLARAQEYLAEYGKTNFSYNIGLHDKFLIENPTLYDALVEGAKLTIHDESIGINEAVVIQSLTITENAEDNVLPQVKVTLNNKPNATTLERIQGQINDIQNTTSGSFSSQSELYKQYQRKLNRSFFDRMFVAVDEAGNEISSTDITTDIAYIKARYHFATVGGMTMFVQDQWTDIPQIVESIPFDNTTIWYNTETKKVEVIGGGGGEEVATTLGALVNVGEWANAVPQTDRIMVQKSGSTMWESLALSEVGGSASFENISESGTGNAYTSFVVSDDKKYLTLVKGEEFTKKADFDVLDSKVSDFLEGSDTDDIINKWKELEAFLSGMSESDDLAEILSGKADKGTTLADYGITDAYTKTDIDTKLAKYVTLGTSQTITGAKNFTGGLSVNGNPIVYEDGCWKLQGNLLITGGMTMYHDDGTIDTSSIFDGLPIDGTTIYWENGVLKAVGGGGAADSVAWDDITGTPSWITSSKPSYSYSEITGTPDLSVYATTAALTSGLSAKANKATTLSGYGITDAKISNGVITLGSATITPLTSHQTIHPLTLQANGTTIGTFDGSSAVTANFNYSNLGLDDRYSLKAGSTSITTLGTITSGTWKGSAIANAYLANSAITISGTSVSLGGSITQSALRTALGLGSAAYKNASGSWGISVTGSSASCTGNAASATKLANARTLWGQSFNGTGNVSGTITGSYFTIMDRNSNPYIKFNQSTSYIGYVQILEDGAMAIGSTSTKSLIVSQNGNTLVAGGITQYSDIRKKTKLHDVELSLKQIADAPLIEHYYNTDSAKTTHVGSVAQYWAGLNDWFCKLDNEGYYTMEIQNCALASAISIARELDRYESETDRRIANLERENEELKREIETLKAK